MVKKAMESISSSTYASTYVLLCTYETYDKPVIFIRRFF